MKLRISIITLAAAATLAFAAPAAAETRGERFQTRISYADLDLSDTVGADVMIDRLRRRRVRGMRRPHGPGVAQ